MSYWKILLILVLIPLLYVIGCILYAKLTYFDPPKLEILYQNDKAPAIQEKEFSCAIWNIGYAGLGEKSDFFHDGGIMTRPLESDMNTYFDGIMDELKDSSLQSDFMMLQEVDSNSKRSYFLDQVSFIKAQAFESHPFSNFAFNYKVNYVPVPFFNPFGKVNSGLLTLSKHKPSKVERHQLPGSYNFPNNLFFLRRCLLVYYFPLENGKELVLINVHNSAYDKEGQLKKQETAYLKSFIEEQDKKGNYILCGGDWNQCPPDFEYNALAKGKEGDYFQTNVKSFIDSGQWVFDSTIATNRKVNKPYKSEKTFTTIIDFFWISKNIEAIECKGKEQNFKYSDHQPVLLKFRLKE